MKFHKNESVIRKDKNQKMKKEMNEFLDEAVREVRQQIGSGYDVAWDIYNRNNNVSRPGLIISDRRHTAVPCIYLDGYYTVYREKEDMELIAKDIIRVYESHKGQCFVTDMVMDREQMLDKVLFRLINTEKNVEVLRDISHYDLCRLGLSVVFYLSLQTEDMEASVQISRGLMKIWDSTETELLYHAQRNTPKKMKAFMCSLDDILHSARQQQIQGRIGMVSVRCQHMC